MQHSREINYIGYHTTQQGQHIIWLEYHTTQLEHPTTQPGHHTTNTSGTPGTSNNIAETSYNTAGTSFKRLAADWRRWTALCYFMKHTAFLGGLGDQPQSEPTFHPQDACYFMIFRTTTAAKNFQACFYNEIQLLQNRSPAPLYISSSYKFYSYTFSVQRSFGCATIWIKSTRRMVSWHRTSVISHCMLMEILKRRSEHLQICMRHSPF